MAHEKEPTMDFVLRIRLLEAMLQQTEMHEDVEGLTNSEIEDFINKTLTVSNHNGLLLARRNAFMRQLKEFTPTLNAALLAANGAAVRRGHEEIAPEHLLLGLIRAQDGVAQTILEQRLNDLVPLQNTIEKQLEQGSLTFGNLPLNRFARATLEMAHYIANQVVRRPQIGTGHLLLAIIFERNVGPGTILINLGLNFEDCMADVNRLIGHEETTSQQGPRPPDRER